jgi:hypothetical protein
MSLKGQQQTHWLEGVVTSPIEGFIARWAASSGGQRANFQSCVNVFGREEQEQGAEGSVFDRLVLRREAARHNSARFAELSA